MSVLTRATQCNITEDDILHSHHRENLKSYTLYFLSELNRKFKSQLIILELGPYFDKTLPLGIKYAPITLYCSIPLHFSSHSDTQETQGKQPTTVRYSIYMGPHKNNTK
jgi:hypothetical protein